MWVCRCVGKRCVLIQCSCQRWAEEIIICSEQINVDALRLEREWAKTKAAQRMGNALSHHAAGPSDPASEVLQLYASIDSISNNATMQKTKSRKSKEGTNCSLATASSSSSGLNSSKKFADRLFSAKDLELLLCCLFVSLSVDDLLPYMNYHYPGRTSLQRCSRRNDMSA